MTQKKATRTRKPKAEKPKKSEGFDWQGAPFLDGVAELLRLGEEFRAYVDHEGDDKPNPEPWLDQIALGVKTLDARTVDEWPPYGRAQWQAQLRNYWSAVQATYQYGRTGWAASYGRKWAALRGMHIAFSD